MADLETIRLEVADGLARLTLDRPDRLNGMTNQMLREARDDVSAVAAEVLTAEHFHHAPARWLR